MAYGLYDGSIESIPGLGGVLQQNRLNDQRTLTNLQQASGAAALGNTLRAQQDDQAIRQILGSGLPPGQVVAGLLKAGPAGVTMATHYLAAQQAQNSVDALKGLDMTNPDALERAALLSPQHAAAFTGMAEKMRQRQADAATHATQVSQATPITEAPTFGIGASGAPAVRANLNIPEPAPGIIPPEVQAQMASGKPFSIGIGPSSNQVENVQRTGGQFAVPMQSADPAIAGAAVSAQNALDASSPLSVKPQHWIDMTNQMQTAEGARAMTRALAGQRDTRAAAGQAITVAGQERRAAAATRREDDAMIRAGLNPDGTPNPASGTLLSPQAIEQAAGRYGLDGTLPSNLGRGVQGVMNTRAILDAAAAAATAKGDTGAASRANQLANKASAAALSQVSRQEGTLGAFEKNALLNADLAVQASDKVDRTGIPVINRWIQAGRTEITGDEDARVFNASNTTFVSEYAKVMSGGSGAAGTTEGFVNRANSLLSTADTPQAYKAIVDRLKLEMSNRMRGFTQEKAELLGGMQGGNTAAPAAQMPSIVNDKGMRLYLRNGQWMPQ